MKRIIKEKNAIAWYAAAMLIITLIIPASVPLNAHAAENPLELLVEQVFSCPPGPDPDGCCCDCCFTYSLKPIEAGNPMPGGRRLAGDYLFDITGTDTEDVGPLSFTQPGIYHYELSQVIGEERTTCCCYDTQVYDIEVIVGEELSADLIVTNQDGMKTARLLFQPLHLDVHDPEDPHHPPPPGETPENDGEQSGEQDDEQSSETPGSNNPTGPNGNNPVSPDYKGGATRRGPKTGDDIRTALYFVMLASGAILAAGTVIYLIAGKKRNKNR